jgi:T5SS/PEP-CTERM-associated repeat protein
VFAALRRSLGAHVRTNEQKAAFHAARKAHWRALALLPSAALLGFAPMAAAQTVTWDGSESDDWTDADNWDIGAPGAGDDVVIDIYPGATISSGVFSAATLNIGPTDDGSLEITGAGTSLTLTGDAVVAQDYFSVGDLLVTDGGFFSANAVTAGQDYFSSGLIEVSGANSRLEASSITIGDHGFGLFQVYDGATVETDDLFLGFASDSPGAYGAIDGVGTSLTADRVQIGVTAGQASIANTSLEVSNGALLTATAGIDIAVDTGSQGALFIGPTMNPGSGAGFVDTPIISMGLGEGFVVFFHDDTGYEFAPEIEGGADDFVFAVSGETILTGDSQNFAGLVAVYPDASLIVNGALSGDFLIGGRLGGSGTVGSIFVDGGGVLAPGNSIGTLNVDGDLEFGYGSIFEIEANASGASDSVAVAGDVLIDGGEVRLLLANGAYAPSTTYRILEADSITGSFDSVYEDYTFFDATLDHGADYVDLIFTRNAFANVALTPNQRNVAGGIEGLGPGDALYDTILYSSAEDAQRAFATMAGDLYPGVANLSARDFLSFANVLTTRLVQAAQAPRRYQLASSSDAVAAPRGPEGAAFWIEGLGAWGEIHSDGNYAELNTQRTGFALGADSDLGDGRYAGLAFGYAQTDFDTDSIDADGESASYHAAFYGGAPAGDYRLRGGLAYAYRSIDTKRIAEVGGNTQRLSANYDSQGLQIFGEIGRSFEFDHGAMEPFFNAALIQQWTGAFSESGGGAALALGDVDQTIFAFTAGAHGGIKMDAVSDLHVSLAWRHAGGDIGEAARAAFASAPDQTFSIDGAPLLTDAALIMADYNVAYGGGFLTFGYNGELGDGASEHGVRLRYRLPL